MRLTRFLSIKHLTINFHMELVRSQSIEAKMAKPPITRQLIYLDHSYTILFKEALCIASTNFFRYVTNGRA